MECGHGTPVSLQSSKSSTWTWVVATRQALNILEWTLQQMLGSSPFSKRSGEFHYYSLWFIKSINAIYIYIYISYFRNVCIYAPKTIVILLRNGEDLDLSNTRFLSFPPPSNKISIPKLCHPSCYWKGRQG